MKKKFNDMDRMLFEFSDKVYDATWNSCYDYVKSNVSIDCWNNMWKIKERYNAVRDTARFVSEASRRRWEES